MKLIHHAFNSFLDIVFETRYHCVAQVCLKLKIFLPQPAECWDYRSALPCLTVMLLTGESLAFICLLAPCSGGPFLFQ
jgi:hypothetical protein